MLLGSVTELKAQHAGAYVIEGSHGGAATGKHAASVGVASLSAHDARIGRDEAGTSCLGPLDKRAIPAACVDVSTARIGEAASTYETGRISLINVSASRLGVRPGQSVPQAIEALLGSDLSKIAEPKKLRSSNLCPKPK